MSDNFVFSEENLFSEENFTNYHPVLKWVGGKTQIKDRVLSYFPKVINNYYEPFIGGASILIETLRYINEKKIKIKGKIIAGDININLISLYKNIQKKPRLLIDEITKLKNEYNTSNDLLYKEEYYYNKRTEFNECKDKTIVRCSALMIFLNKTCFRGLYREGKNGFNVPFGHYLSPEIFSAQHILDLSFLFKNVDFIHTVYSNLLKDIKENDFVYLDPPYLPEKKNGFVDYNKQGFSLDKHKQLFSLCREMKKNNILFLLSNNNVDLIYEEFKNCKIDIVECRRRINSKNPESNTNEVLIS